MTPRPDGNVTTSWPVLLPSAIAWVMSGRSITPSEPRRPWVASGGAADGAGGGDGIAAGAALPRSRLVTSDTIVGMGRSPASVWSGLSSSMASEASPGLASSRNRTPVIEGSLRTIAHSS